MVSPMDFYPEELPFGRGAVRFETSGIRLLRRRGSDRPLGPVYPYADITHMEVSRRAIAVGLRKNTLVFRRRHFAHPDGPERLARALASGIWRQPGGRAQWSRIEAVDRLAARPSARFATTGVVLLCIVVMVFQMLDPFVQDVGSFAPQLVASGEWWRILSGSLLHSQALFPSHIAMNLLLIVGFGLLVERPLGPVRTLIVMAFSGIGAMFASSLAGYNEVIGASGLAAGLVGAELALEIHYCERLPASWRLSRPIFLTVLALQAALDLALPFVAGAAHLGGFLVGYLLARAMAPEALSGAAPSRGLRNAAAAVVLVTVVSLLTPLPLLLRDGEALGSHATALLQSRDLPSFRYNDLAWRMATESQLSPDQAELAIALAERAVSETQRQNPDVLDTLAETLFVAGDKRSAVAVIDEAIALANGEVYFVEQRRRFTGERDADDRPEPPFVPWFLRQPGEGAVPIRLFDPSKGVEI